MSKPILRNMIYRAHTCVETKKGRWVVTDNEGSQVIFGDGLSDPFTESQICTWIDKKEALKTI